MVNIAVFASGNGSNFAAIAEAVKRKKIRAKLALLVCDSPVAYVIKRAEKAAVKVALVKRGDFTTREEFEREVLRNLKSERIGLIVMAGFMRMLGKTILKPYKNRILNIHPALLPAFKGATAIKDAFAYGVKITGVTVHFVDEFMDHGPIVLQAPVEIKKGDTLASLEARIHKLEHRLYPQAIKLFIEGRLETEGRKVKVVNP